MNATYEPMPGSENLLLEAVSELLDTCIEKGLSSPFFIIALAIGGYVLVVRATESPDGSFQIDPWAEHSEDSMTRLYQSNSCPVRKPGATDRRAPRD